MITLAHTEGACVPSVHASSTGYPSESVSSSKWHVWFASRCPGRRLSTWQMIPASCPTALGALCGQLMLRLVWCVTTQQLRQQNFYSRWTLLVEISSGPASQSRLHLRSDPMTAEGIPFLGSIIAALCDF